MGHDPEEQSTSSHHIFSIIVPAHNERDNIAPLFGAISDEMPRCNSNLSVEVIIVDDGSDDETYAEIATTAKKTPPHSL